jgi:hypothetical protein
MVVGQQELICQLILYALFFSFFIVILNFLLGYVHYIGGFVVTIPIRLMLYTIYVAPINLSPSAPPFLDIITK